MPKDPKFETNSNDQNMENSKQASFGFGVLDFPDLRFICEFVSDFGAPVKTGKVL
jgi:hypothetical protein